MRTDVFPKEDSVRVVWAPLCDCRWCRQDEDAFRRWVVRSRSKRAGQLRFNMSPHGRMEDGRRCDSVPDDDGGCRDSTIRFDLPFVHYDSDRLNEAYRLGLAGGELPNGSQRIRNAYSMGADEAQLIDWQA